MATFTKTFGTAPPRDAFYPNVLTPDLQLDAGKVQDAFRRTFDFLYKINPPVGSRTSSSVLSTYNFVPTFTVNLNNNMFLLDGENWNSSTAGVSWNAHTLTYHGKQYSIAAGGPTTNKFIYWSLDNANIYQSSATFPTLNFVDVTDNSVAAGLVAVWNSSDGKLYPFWSAKLAPAFISTALIEDASITTALIANLAVTNAKINDLAVDKLTTGSLTATISITSGVFRTATSNPMITVDNTNGLRAINAGGVTTVQIPNNGATIDCTILRGIGIGPLQMESSSSGLGNIRLFDASIDFKINGTVAMFKFDSSNNMTILASGSGIQWIDTNSSAIASTAAQMDFYLKIGPTRTNMARFDNTSGVGVTNFYLYENAALKNVTVGANDSGGVGFRLLRIPN